MSDEAPDPLMLALYRKLPEPGTVWPIGDRMLWLAACEAVINFIYGPTSDSITLPPFLKDVLQPDTVELLKSAPVEEPVREPETPEQEAADEVVAPVKVVPPFRKTFSRTGATPAALSPRPKGIPTTFGMIQDVLDKTPGLTANELVAVIAARWWPGLEFKRIAPDISTWVTKGRIARDADGKLTLTEQGRRAESFDLRKIAIPSPDVAALVAPVMSTTGSETVVLAPKALPPPARDHEAAAVRFAATRVQQRTPTSVKGQTARQTIVDDPFEPKPASPQPQPAAGTHQFGYGSSTVLLSLKEHRILSKLKAAMGKGMLEGRMLVDVAFAGEAAKISNSESYLYELMRALNPRLDILGIEMAGVPTMPGSAKIAGYVLRAK